MNISQIPQRIDEIAFRMLHLSPEDRERCFNDAFAYVQAKHPDMTDPPLSFVTFVAAVYRRIAELEQHAAGNA